VAIGFKDEKKKFHPITVSKQARQVRSAHLGRDLRVGQDGTQLTKLLSIQVKDFAKSRAIQFKNLRAEQIRKRDADLVRKRKFKGQILRLFRDARIQFITKPKELKDFIFSGIPDLKDDKENLRFVTQIIQEFLDREKEFKKKIRDKPEEERKILEKEFKDAEERSAETFETATKQLNKDFDKNQDKKVKNLQNLIDKFRDKEKKLKESEKQEDTAKTTEQKEKATQDVKEDRKQTQDAVDDVREALRDTKPLELETPFPSEIVSGGA